MKKIIVGAMVASMLMSSTLVYGAEAQTRTADMKIKGVKVEFEETLHDCEQGYSLWYSAELLKEDVFGGNECFIPVDEEKAEESPVKFIVVVEDEENTAIGLEETLAAYESSGETYEKLEISEIETETLESGLIVDSAQVIWDDNADYFYQVKDEAEENVLYITASMPADEQETYTVWFDRMVETVEFTAEELVHMDYTGNAGLTLATCSLCEVEKDCGYYEADGAYYYVCDDCFNEFAHAFGLYGVDEVCSLCGTNSDTECYEVDGQSYYVCYSCYDEFATAFGLYDETTTSTKVCSLCQVEKECGTYEADGEYYDVCDDCFNEFATAFGLYGADKEVCGLCEATSDTECYVVDGQSYYVCPACYGEFAEAFGLN